MNSNFQKEHELVLYTWFELEASLKGYLHQKVKELPEWANKQGYKTTDELHKVYKDRLIYEFEVVKKMGFLGYFLIVADMINYCRQQSIPTGPGRGSASGSLIGFLLKITKVDPIRYNLLFERFLNPDRASMPDVDIDVSQRYRHLVKDYFTKKYGVNKVASIGTFSRMKVRAAVKDIVRSLNLGGSVSESFKLADKISKTLEEEDPDIDYDQALKVPSFKNYMDDYPIIARHLRKCEDVLRQTSMHAAGVLISAAPLEEELPLMVDKNGMVVTAYDGKTCESQGYLKLDTLGLKNLDTISDTRKMIKNLYGFVPEMSIDGIEIQVDEDPDITQQKINAEPNEVIRLASKAYKYLREESTLGIFQCEQPVTQDLLRRGNVNSIEDIADILALIRPGPRKAGSTDIYIARKRKEAEVEYSYNADPLPGEIVYKLENLDENDRQEYIQNLIEFLERQLDDGKLASLEERRRNQITDDDDFLGLAYKFCSWIAQLKNSNFQVFDVSLIREICHHTQGLPLFQEQLMQISVRCAGFTKGQSDNLRKAVGKKDQKLIKQMGDMFISGLVKGGAELNESGIDLETAKFIWYKFILPYGSYGFNASHSISYSLISYETVWLKANFPGPFYASLLSHESDQDQINKIITEAKNAGISFLPPNVNQSSSVFVLVDPTTIVYSLTYMKGVGEAAVEKIIQNRPYKNMIDFIGRSGVNQSVAKILIKGGAFDNAFDDEKISRKNYFDFYEDCKERLQRQTGRLLRDQLIKKFGYVKSQKGLSLDKQKQETPGQFHDRLMSENEEYKNLFLENEKKEIESFVYDWTAPITFNNKGVAILVQRSSEDDRDRWNLEEQLEFEEKIFGTTISAHRLDNYKAEEKNFFKNANQQAITIFDLAKDLKHYQSGEVGYLFCQGVRFAAEFPYKNDKKQFVRLYEFETRANKITVSVFEKMYQDCLKKDSLNPLTLMKKNYPYKPIVIIKCRMNDYRGLRTIVLEEIANWINEDQIKQAIKHAKQTELMPESTLKQAKS